MIFLHPFYFIHYFYELFRSGIKKNEIFYLYSQIWKELIIEHLSEIGAQILRAHGKFFISVEENSLILNFQGFSDTIDIMIQRVVEEMNGCDFGNKKEKFERILECMNLENEKFFNSDPWLVCDHFFRVILLKQGVYHKKALLDFGRKLTFQNFLEFSTKMIAKSKSEWFFYM